MRILKLFDDLSVFIIRYSILKSRRIFLSPKTIGLSLLILFLCSQTVLSEEPAFSDEFFFYEEFFLSDEIFPNEGSFLSMEAFPRNDDFLSEEFFPSDESLLSEETFPSEEYLLSDEFLSGGEYLLSEDHFPDEESFFYDETYLTEDAPFVFEAPPLIYEVPRFVYELRSFNDIYPNLSLRQKAMAFNTDGLKYYFGKDDSPALLPAPNSGIDLLSSVMIKKPSHIIEAMVVVPYRERELDILDVYNALGKIEDLKKSSFYINGKYYNIFEETTRIESARNRKPVSDPPPADMLPYAETMYLRFKDSDYGNLYIRGEVTMSLYGITYSLTNFTDVRYFIIPIMKAEGISIIIYLEPLKEGVLVYSMSGLHIPGFIADRVNLTPSINRRINALISWITEGLRRQESMLILREQEIEVLEIGRAQVLAGD
jgi:hypothetical protein